MSETAQMSAGDAEILCTVLARAFPDAARVAVAGESELARALRSTRPDVFVPAEQASGAAAPEVLVVEPAGPALAGAADVARHRGARVWVLLDGRFTAEVRRSIHDAGLAVAETQRVLWSEPPNGTLPVGPRLERLDAETRALLVRCVRIDDPAEVVVLEQTIERLQHEVDVHAQLRVDQARALTVERERAQRLERAERRVGANARETIDRLDAENERLRAELEQLQATRLWRLGQRYWTLRDRLRRRRASP